MIDIYSCAAKLGLDLKNDHTLENLYLLCCFIGFAGYFILRYIYKKKGIALYSRKSLSIFLIVMLFPALIFLWLMADISLAAKIGITALGLGVEFANYYAIDKAGRRVRKNLGIENEEDRWEKEQAAKTGESKDA